MKKTWTVLYVAVVEKCSTWEAIGWNAARYPRWRYRRLRRRPHRHCWRCRSSWTNHHRMSYWRPFRPSNCSWKRRELHCPNHRHLPNRTCFRVCFRRLIDPTVCYDVESPTRLVDWPYQRECLSELISFVAFPTIWAASSPYDRALSVPAPQPVLAHRNKFADGRCEQADLALSSCVPSCAIWLGGFGTIPISFERE